MAPRCNNSAGIPRRLRSRVMIICVVAGLAAAAGCRASQEPVRRNTQLIQAPPAVAQSSTPSTQMQDSAQPTIRRSDDKSADGRKKLFAAGCADLLRLANELKTQVDKTTADVLSVGAIRKADAIEQLARKLREQVKSADPEAVQH
ncbi:MAG: hypothetical protein ACLGRW_00235 [Acidobacteriota bacterium]